MVIVIEYELIEYNVHYLEISSNFCLSNGIWTFAKTTKQNDCIYCLWHPPFPCETQLLQCSLNDKAKCHLSNSCDNRRTTSHDIHSWIPRSGWHSSWQMRCSQDRDYRDAPQIIWLPKTVASWVVPLMFVQMLRCPRLLAALLNA